MGFLKRYYENAALVPALREKNEAKEALILALKKEIAMLKEERALILEDNRAVKEQLEDLQKRVPSSNESSPDLPTQAKIVNEWFNGEEGADV